jgi:glycosyltransferase involved in cell wall biosynthesis
MTIPSLIDFFSKPNLVIFDSDWQASEVFRSFIYHLPKEKFVTAYCGARAATASVTRHTDLSTTLNVVNVGSVYGRKRQFDLASAVVELNRRYSLRCNFIGSLKYIHTFGETALPFMQQHVDALNFTDALTEAEKQNYLINADMACFPSGDETFNISAMEAANYGIPVILADLPVYEELGWRHGSNCLKYPVANVPALEKEIEKLVLDVELRQRLGDAGKALAEKFTVDAFLERITTLVESQKRSIV